MKISNDRLRKFIRNKWVIRTAVVLFLFLILYWCRYPIMRGLGNFLISEDAPEQVDAIFVLGGNSEERAKAAARLYHDGYSTHLICTGGNKPGVLRPVDSTLYEADITRMWLDIEGVPAHHSHVLIEGTSTKEEAEAVARLCKAQGLDKVMILSSRFHTRRVRGVFTPALNEAGVKLLVCGAPSLSYDEAEWWKAEQGILMVNNEYMKLMYYALKY